jgi:hypothetical protein
VLFNEEFLAFSNDRTEGQVEEIRWQKNSDGSNQILFVNEAQLPSTLVNHTFVSDEGLLVVATAVPEPNSVVLGCLAFFGFLFHRSFDSPCPK